MQPSLKDFLLRAQASTLLRSALRSARAAPSHARADLEAAVKAEFAAGRSARGAQARFLLSDGRVRLTQLREALGMSGLAPLEP